jgi:GntR family transcriptional regulator
VKIGHVARRLARITPLYHQIFAKLRAEIAEGVYQKDDALPGEHDLAARFEVSRITVRRALEELAAHGLIVREHGSGTFVSGRSASPPLRTSIDDFLRYNVAITEDSKPHLLSYALIDAGPYVAGKLQLEPGEPVYQLRLVRKRRGPTIYSIGYYPRSIGDRIDPSIVGKEPTLVWLKRMRIAVSKGDVTITAVAADADQATVLDVAAGAPLLVTDRVLFDRAQKPLELARMVIRPDCHEFAWEFAATPAQRTNARK